jgi:hypothetical protein
MDNYQPMIFLRNLSKVASGASSFSTLMILDRDMLRPRGHLGSCRKLETIVVVFINRRERQLVVLDISISRKPCERKETFFPLQHFSFSSLGVGIR